MKEIKYTILYCVGENFRDSIWLFYGSVSAQAKSYGFGSATQVTGLQRKRRNSFILWFDLH